METTRNCPTILMPAGRAIWWGARWAAGTAGGAGAAGTTRTKWCMFPASEFGHHFVDLFRLAFWTYGICFFTHAHGDNFKLFFALTALIFVNRHIFTSLTFFVLI